ncbi:MAG: heme-degrading domain-containing protein [Paenibacillaceae bacterium]
MESIEKLLIELQQQEEEVQFASFNHEIALEVGLAIIKEVKNRGKSVSIHIERNNRVLFHYAMQGTTPDNDEWLRRKCNVVQRFEMSSYRMSNKLKTREGDLERIYQAALRDHAASGGAFPIIIKNVGVVGAVAISGLPDSEDHEIVVSTLRKFL